MLGLTDAGVAAIIAAVCSGAAAIIASVAVLVTALNRRDVREVKAQVTTTNGRTVAETVERIEADVIEVARKQDTGEIPKVGG